MLVGLVIFKLVSYISIIFGSNVSKILAIDPKMMTIDPKMMMLTRIWWRLTKHDASIKFHFADFWITFVHFLDKNLIHNTEIYIECKYSWIQFIFTISNQIYCDSKHIKTRRTLKGAPIDQFHPCFDHFHDDRKCWPEYDDDWPEYDDDGH